MVQAKLRLASIENRSPLLTYEMTNDVNGLESSLFAELKVQLSHFALMVNAFSAARRSFLTVWSTNESDDIVQDLQLKSDIVEYRSDCMENAGNKVVELIDNVAALTDGEVRRKLEEISSSVFEGLQNDKYWMIESNPSRLPTILPDLIERLLSTLENVAKSEPEVALPATNVIVDSHILQKIKTHDEAGLASDTHSPESIAKSQKPKRIKEALPPLDGYDKLDKSDGKWVEGNSPEWLDLSGGRKNLNRARNRGECGPQHCKDFACTYGRHGGMFWRRDPEDKQVVWYLKSTIKKKRKYDKKLMESE